MVAGRRSRSPRGLRDAPGGNRFGGRARTVVQVGRDVHGGVRVFAGPVYQAADRALAVPRQLGRPASTFVDREELFQALDAVLDSVRAGLRQVALLVGSGGAGKTASIDAWAAARPEAFACGHLSADLRGFGTGAALDPSEVAGRFLRSLGFKGPEIPAGPDERLKLYRSEIADRELLIVLDNAATSAQVRPLLPSRPGPMVVVTSRRELPGLESRDGARRLKVGMLDERHAVELLRAAILMHDSDGVGEAALTRLTKVCAGLPLALSLVAEQLVRPRAIVRELVEQVEDNRRLLDGLASAEEPEKTVRAAFDASYRALAPKHAEFFRSLAFYPGPDFAPETAAALSSRALASAMEFLAALEDVHLLERVGERFRMHDLLRVFALERAQDTPLQRQASERLVHWFAQSALAAARALGTASLPVHLPPCPPGVPVTAFAEQAGALAWFERERAGLPDVLTAAKQIGGALAWQLPAALLGLHMTTNAFDEWTMANELGYRAARASADREAIAAMAESKGKCARQLHRLPAATDDLSEALTLRRELGDERGAARVVNVLGLVDAEAGRWEQAERRFAEAVASADRLEETDLAAFARISLGWVRCETGRYREALESLERAADVLRASDRQIQLADALQRRASALRALGRTMSALESAAEAVAICRRLNNGLSLAQALREQALCLMADGRPEAALESLDVALAIHQELDDRWRAASVHKDAGDAQAALGHIRNGAGQYRIAADIYRSLGHRADANRCETLAEALEATGDPQDS